MLRLLANENIPGEVVTELRRRGHDVAWIRTDCPGLADAAVLERARREGRLLVTFDKDFGEQVFARGAAASRGIVLFRVSTPSPRAAVERVVTTLESRADWADMFSTVDDARIRMVPLPPAASA